MTRRVAAAALAALLWPAFAAHAQDWRAGSDPRVELLSILFRLAGNNEYHRCRIPAYDKVIESYFAPYRDHEAVRLARALEIGFEAPMKLAVNLRDAESLAERVPFDSPGVHLYQNWDAAKARDFLTAARRFVIDTHFADFLKSQQPLYAAADLRLRTVMQERADLGWFDRFFGPRPPARLIVVPGLANGGPSYAARVIDEGGVQEIYAIPGVSKVDAEGAPVFDTDWRTTMVHQFAHAYANPVTGKFAGGMEQAARRIYEPVAAAMKRQSFGAWRIMLNESLSRAVAVEYVLEHDGPEAAQRVIRQDNARSFFWTSELVALLDTYRTGRRQYPTLESFMPRVSEFFNNLAPRIHELADRLQPKIVSTSIADGAQDVDPATKSIVVHFSMAMNRTGPGKGARASGGSFDETGAAVTIPVTLEPGRDYVLPLRWAGGQAFVSAEGVPLPDTLLHFHTALQSKPQ